MGFADSIRATTKKQLEQVDKRIEHMAVTLFTAVVDFSPKQPAAKYSKGEFINNWKAVINGHDFLGSGYLSDTGSASRDSIKAVTGKNTFLRRDGYITLSNGTSYSDLVEYKGWPQSINPRWTGRVGPYAPVRTAFIMVVPTLKQP